MQIKKMLFWAVFFIALMIAHFRNTMQIKFRLFFIGCLSVF